MNMWNCPECGLSVEEKRRRGPHLSACRRSKNAKYKYLPGDTKHPYEYKACKTCGVQDWYQVRRAYCSYRCSKLGDLNPSKNKSSNHNLSKVEYSKAHKQVRKARGKAFGCMHCGTTDQRVYHWANLTGSYWDVYDYINLCVPCHDTFDRRKDVDS